MIDVSFVDQSSIDRANALLRGIKGGALKAVYFAMKRAAASAKTEAGRYASATYTLTKEEFMRKVNIKSRSSYAENSVASVSVSFAGNVLNLPSYDLSYGRMTKKMKHNPLRVRVMRAHTKTRLERTFVANIWGHMGVYERVGEHRFPLHEDYGPSAAHILENPEVKGRMSEKMNEVFDKRVEHEILRILNGWGT